MQQTSNYSLNKPEQTDTVNIDDLNTNFEILDAELKKVSDKANYIQIAAGSATVITLSNVTLVNGFTVTFVVAANNNGAATTINGKNLYKPGGTAAPKLIAGRAVTVWYNGSNFFIKASASGNATADKVLAPYTISTDEDIDIVGTMTDIGPESAETTNLTNQNQEYIIAKGFHSGLRKIKAIISGLTANVIKAGVTVGGIAGTFTADATATAAHMLSGVYAYVNGSKVDGNIPSLGNEEYYGWRRATVNASPIPGRGHFRIPLGAYLSGAPEQGGQLGVFCDDPEFIAANILNTANIFGMQGGIPVVNPDYSDQLGALTISVGSYSGDGANYAYMNHGLNGKYCNGANWVRSYEPYLRPEYILNSASIMGVQGAAIAGKRFASGIVTSTPTNSGYYVGGGGQATYLPNITVSGLTFIPSLIVVIRLGVNITDNIIYCADGIGLSQNPAMKIVLHRYSYAAYQNQSNLVGMFGVSDSAYITNTGFNLPVIATGTNHIYYAIE